MITRALERSACLRATVGSARVSTVGATSIEFATTAALRLPRAVSSADSAMFAQAKAAAGGDTTTGRIRVDMVADGIMRVRYVEGSAVRETTLPLVVAAPVPLRTCAIDAATPGIATLRTAELTVSIALDPWRIDVRRADGTPVCGISGPEKNFFNLWDSLGTGLLRPVVKDGGGGAIAVESFDLRPNECIYGLGEKFIKLDKVGQTIDLETSDALGVLSPRSYKNVPFFVSTRGYGVFFNHASRMTYWVGSRSAADVQVAADDDFLDYYVIAGDIRTILARYTGLTGRGTLPPKWTFGYWQSKISYTSADETLEIARRMRDAEVPFDVLHLDTHWFKADWYCDLEFDPVRFPEPAAWFAAMRDLGVNISLWQLPYIPEGSALYDAIKAVDGFVTRPDGSIYDLGICFTPGFKGTVGLVDYTNPRAVRAHQDAFRRLFRLGAKVIKTDFGEAAPGEGAVYHDGTPARQMHNLYPLLYNRAISEVTAEETGS
ncbi:MAG TPA: TIM-barrel domain-containing protein, partial [Planctomycetota bacterium]|nr:TIM-barrel domain-containing protein [Planctomycetota bacterium]